MITLNVSPMGLGNGSNPDRASSVPFDIQQVPSRVVDEVSLPASLAPGVPIDAPKPSQDFRILIGASVVLLIIFLLRD